MNCRELVELVTEYLDGALRGRDRARFLEHVSTCEGCSVHVEQMRTTLAVLGRLEPRRLSAETERELLAAFRGWKRTI